MSASTPPTPRSINQQPQARERDNTGLKVKGDTPANGAHRPADNRLRAGNSLIKH